MCVCKKGYTEDKNGECKKCKYYLGNCVLTCPENTLLNEETNHCNTINYDRGNIQL